MNLPPPNRDSAKGETEAVWSHIADLHRKHTELLLKQHEMAGGGADFQAFAQSVQTLAENIGRLADAINRGQHPSRT